MHSRPTFTDMSFVPGVSLRSAMSVDMDSSEVDKVRREFEMYKIGKQNEMSDLIKKEKKLESENRRLRAELQVTRHFP